MREGIGGGGAVVLALSLIGATAGPPETAGVWPRNVDGGDRAYLRKLQRETWDYIDYFIAPETGFPHDNNSRQGKTNTTNLGMYLASLSMAAQLGYIDRSLAIERVRTILDSLDRYEHWKRLYNNWLDPSGVYREAYPGPNNISDYNKLPAGLIVVRQTFPELAARCSAFLDEIPWEVFYEARTGKMNYEFDVKQRSVRNPVFFYRGEDKILGHFLAIAAGKVPPESWDRHDLSMENKYGYDYYLHGWQGGGLFMQFICGLFVDDRGTKLGRSAAHFAWAQMVHAAELGAPVWGWSACAGPSEKYHGMGDIQDDIVTPHASALAIHLFPREVIDNLRRLEAYGLRAPYEADGRTHRFGFRDSVNWRTGDIAQSYLILDQAMLFLALVNFTENGLLWKTFGRDPLVRHGKRVISEFGEATGAKREEQELIASLSHDAPGAIWWSPGRGAGIEPGVALQRDIWIRSLAAHPMRDLVQTWSVEDGAGSVIAAGAFEIEEVRPRDFRRVGTISAPTNLALRGDRWIVRGDLKGKDGRVIRSHRESVRFPSTFSLEGEWKIRAGDDPSWSDPRLNDAAWRGIRVPDRWESAVLPDYDGLAWYRLRFRVPAEQLAAWTGKPLAVVLGCIDDADESYLNGAKIGGTGAFPPAKETAFNEIRRYPISAGQLKEENVIAVRVADWGGFGGIWKGPLAIGPRDELDMRPDGASR